MFELNSVPGVFCDSYVEHQGYIIFISLWGRDTAIQELLARITLRNHGDGLTQLALENNPVLQLGNPERLDKITGRMPKHNLLGDMVHLWLFDKTTQQPDFSNRKAYWLFQPNDKSQHDSLWQVVMTVCHLPMLTIWQPLLLERFLSREWLYHCQGHLIDAWYVTLPEAEVEAEIQQLIQSGQLKLC